MKRAFAIILAAVLLLAGCSAAGEQAEKSGSSFTVRVKNLTVLAVYGIHCEYLIGEAAQGGMFASGDGMIADGGSAEFTFYESDFSGTPDLSLLVIELYLSDGTAETFAGKMPVAAEWGGAYNVSITSENGKLSVSAA